MARYKLLIEYDGYGFCGWQRQEEEESIQGSIEKALYKMAEQPVTVVGAGRTDAGVHALGQVAHFDMIGKRSYDTQEILGALNFYLKAKKISILSIEKADDNFHARFSAKSRSYKYKIVNRSAPLAVQAGMAWHIKEQLDIELMNKAAQILVGKHDLTSFRSTQCQSPNPIRTIDSISLIQKDENIEMKITAPSFLHNQVRIIIGSLRKIGNLSWEPEKLQHVLRAKDRKLSAETAPPDGLYLEKILY